MDLKEFKEQEYDAQLFGFTVEDFMIAIRLLVKDEVTHFTDAMTTALIKKYADDDPEIGRVKEITKSLIDQYMNASVEPLKTLETQLKDLLHIPAHVLLPGDTIQRTQYSASEEKEMDSQLSDLLMRIKRTKSFDVELHQELKILRDALPLLTRMVGECERLVAERNESEKVLEVLMPSVDEMVNHRLFLLSLNQDSSDSTSDSVENSS
uniref:Protein MIS12 homolog n=1 Tax=Homalodisca liturata TaxID=320908 RepID=A0A1B6K1J9_9HEMI